MGTTSEDNKSLQCNFASRQNKKRFLAERHQTEILTTFGHWIGFGGLDGRLLQKTGNGYCTIIAIRKSVTATVTLDRPADWRGSPGAKDTSLKLFVKIDKKSGLAVHIRNKGDWQSISKRCALQSDMTEIRPRLGREPECTAEIANVSPGQNLRGSGKYLKIVGKSGKIVGKKN